MEFILNETILNKHIMLEINGYLYKYTRQYQRKVDNNLVFYWTCLECKSRIQTIKVAANKHIIDPRGKRFSFNDHCHRPNTHFMLAN